MRAFIKPKTEDHGKVIIDLIDTTLDAYDAWRALLDKHGVLTYVDVPVRITKCNKAV